MAPKLRIYLLELAKEIVIARDEQITAKNILIEFNLLSKASKKAMACICGGDESGECYADDRVGFP